MPISQTELTQLIDLHWASLTAWVGPAGGIADDMVQMAFIQLASQEPAPDQPIAWLFTVTHRLAINRRQSDGRRNHREQRLAAEKQSDSTTLTDDPSRGLETQELMQSLDQLDEAERQVVVAKIWGELNFDEIAHSLDCSRTTAWRTYRSAIEKLQRTYGDFQ